MVNHLVKPLTSRSTFWPNLSVHIKKLQIGALFPSHVYRFSYLGMFEDKKVLQNTVNSEKPLHHGDY